MQRPPLHCSHPPLLCLLLASVLVMYILISSNRPSALWIPFLCVCVCVCVLTVTRFHLSKEIVIVPCLLAAEFVYIQLCIFYYHFISSYLSCFYYASFTCFLLAVFYILCPPTTFHFISHCVEIKFYSYYLLDSFEVM